MGGIVADTALAPQYAGFGRRFAALIIDLIAINISALVVAFVIDVAINMAGSHASPATMTSLYQMCYILVTPVYAIFFWGRFGWSPGKRTMGLRIVGPNSAAQGIGYGRAALRLLGYIASFYTFLLGFLWILWDKERQGFHDKIASTHVVRV